MPSTAASARGPAPCRTSAFDHPPRRFLPQIASPIRVSVGHPVSHTAVRNSLGFLRVLGAVTLRHGAELPQVGSMAANGPAGRPPTRTEIGELCVHDEDRAPSGSLIADSILGRAAGKGYREMHPRMLGRQLFDQLARQLAARSGPRNAESQSAKAPGTLPDPPKERTTAREPNVGTVLYLISLGVVATATVVVFFGLGFFLLAHHDEELIADTRDRGVEVAPQHADLVSPPNKDAAPFPALTAPAPSVPPGLSPETHEVLPPASKDTALGSASAADTVANATSDAWSSQDQPGLRSNADEAALATPTEVTRAKRTGMGQHRHAGARKHWARISQPGANSRPPPAIGGPERAWHWIVQSATGILAALSPPPSRQAAGLKTRWRAD
jgi:hypothetical protein